METVALLAPFVLLGVGVLFVAFSGGPGRAREAYLTRGGRLFRVLIPLIYAGFGIALPAIVIADRDEAEGGTPRLEDQRATTRLENGKQLFEQTCASCHTLAAVNARGVTGPNLDQIGTMTEERVLNAIKVGGTGQKRMPAGLLTGEDAEEVASFVAEVAGK
jgi:cytochrome c551